MKSIANRLTLAVTATLFATLFLAFIALIIYSNSVFNKYLSYETQIKRTKIEDTLISLSNKLTSTVIYAENMTRLSYEPTNILTEIKAVSPYVDQIIILDEDYVTTNVEPFVESSVGVVYALPNLPATISKWPYFFINNGSLYGLQASTIAIGSSSRLIGYVVIAFNTNLLFDDLAKLAKYPLGMCYKGELIISDLPQSLAKNSMICSLDNPTSKDDTFIVRNNFLLDDLSVAFALSGFYAKFAKASYSIVLLIVFAGLSVLSFVIIRLLSVKITKSISLLTGEVAEIRDEQYEVGLSHTYESCEVNILAQTINRMLTTIKKYRADLERQSKLAAVGQSTAMVAHDVRKPLASMKALLTALPAIKDDPAELKNIVATVDRNISQTNAMLNDILEFSRDSTSLDLKENNPGGLITSALSDALRNHPGSNIAIEYDLQHLYALKTDVARITRVLTNIIDNALDAMTSPQTGKALGTLRFETSDIERDGVKYGRIVIADNGPGIPKEALERIFDPFFTQGKKGGTGLGLAICHRIITLHGGRIEASNCAGGKGAQFTIELPLGKDRVGRCESELIRNSAELEQFRIEESVREDYGDTANTSEFLRINKERGRKSYLLIVDDEPLFRESVRATLNELREVRDYVKFIEVDSAENAMPVLDTREFDYVIADIDLGSGQMNGYEFALTILEKYPNTYVLIHSNKRKEELDRDIRAKANPMFMGFLPKPMRPAELLQFLACKTFETNRAKIAEGSETKKVLVVNDDDALIVAFKVQLTAPNVQVLSAGNVSTALKALTEQKVDLILSDINLGNNEPTGYDLLKKVRETDQALPFYMVSGFSASDEEPKARENGATGYLQLPVESAQLRKLVQ